MERCEPVRRSPATPLRHGDRQAACRPDRCQARQPQNRRSWSHRSGLRADPPGPKRSGRAAQIDPALVRRPGPTVEIPPWSGHHARCRHPDCPRASARPADRAGPPAPGGHPARGGRCCGRRAPRSWPARPVPPESRRFGADDSQGAQQVAARSCPPRPVAAPLAATTDRPESYGQASANRWRPVPGR